MPYHKAHGIAGPKNRELAHAEILTGSLHKSQLEEREDKLYVGTISLPTPNANGRLQIVVQNPRAERLKPETLPCDDDVNGAAENPMCFIATNCTCHSY